MNWLAHDYTMTTEKWIAIAALIAMLLIFLGFLAYIIWEDEKWKRENKHLLR